MAHKAIVLALGLMVVASPGLASGQLTPAPPGTPSTRYCLRVTITGLVGEPVECWTRDEWAEQGVDVDREWAANGVRVIEG